MFDLSGKISELKDKMLGKKKEEKEETPAQLTDYDYIRKAARLMRRIVDDSRVDFAEGRQNHRRLLAAYCYGALAVFDRDNGERAALVRSVMYQMLTRKFLFPEAYSESLIEQLHRVREEGGDDALMEMIRRGEAYYERLQQGNRFLSARDAAAAFRMLLFEEENDIYIAAPGDERIHEFEKAHGVKFPEEYISFLKAHNGAVMSLEKADVFLREFDPVGLLKLVNPLVSGRGYVYVVLLFKKQHTKRGGRIPCAQKPVSLLEPLVIGFSPPDHLHQRIVSALFPNTVQLLDQAFRIGLGKKKLPCQHLIHHAANQRRPFPVVPVKHGEGPVAIRRQKAPVVLPSLREVNAGIVHNPSHQPCGLPYVIIIRKLRGRFLLLFLFLSEHFIL